MVAPHHPKQGARGTTRDGRAITQVTNQARRRQPTSTAANRCATRSVKRTLPLVSGTHAAPTTGSLSCASVDTVAAMLAVGCWA